MLHNTAAPAEPASTVILVREIDSGIEVYLTRRRRELKFMGGFHVFPGGKVDAEDSAQIIQERCPVNAAQLALAALDTDSTPEAGLGFFVAGIRELFEEAGILIVNQASGEQFTFEDDQTRQRFMDYRDLIQQGKLQMMDMLERENLYYATNRLLWFSHWVTPVTSPRRFDTQFFISLLPPNQKTRAFEGEIDHSSWYRPGQAIKQWIKGQIKIIPPTLASLDRLSKFKRWEQIQQAFSKTR